jgi:transposase-like protein
MNEKNSKQRQRVLKRYTTEDRVKYVEEYNKSGLIQAAFCREKGINAVTFGGWLKKSSKHKAKFIEVSLPPVAPAGINQFIEVKLSGGAQIKIPAALDTERVADLVRRITKC